MAIEHLPISNHQMWILIYNKVEMWKARNATQRKIVREYTMSRGKRKQKKERKKRRKTEDKREERNKRRKAGSLKQIKKEVKETGEEEKERAGIENRGKKNRHENIRKGEG
jgi:hypothetical protein